MSKLRPPIRSVSKLVAAPAHNDPDPRITRENHAGVIETVTQRSVAMLFLVREWISQSNVIDMGSIGSMVLEIRPNLDLGNSYTRSLCCINRGARDSRDLFLCRLIWRRRSPRFTCCPVSFATPLHGFFLLFGIQWVEWLHARCMFGRIFIWL